MVDLVIRGGTLAEIPPTAPREAAEVETHSAVAGFLHLIRITGPDRPVEAATVMVTMMAPSFGRCGG